MSSSVVAICNRALSAIGARTTIADLSERAVAAQACALWYDNTRQSLLRAAPWGFARKQLVLTELGKLSDATAPYPYLFKYAYPSDCLKFRYLIPPPQLSDVSTSEFAATGDGNFWGWTPSRACRFIVNSDVDPDGNQIKTILSNLCQAIGTYTYDCDDPNMFDASFDSALSSALAYHLCIPLSGNVGMMESFRQKATDSVNNARANDANEAIPSSDISVDWIATRSVGYGYGYPSGAGSLWGDWYSGFDNGWGM